MMLALLTAGVAGCNEAEEQCKDFSAAMCDRLVECSDDGLTKDACLAEFGKTIDCSKAVDPPSNFDQCIPAVKKLSCGSLKNIPDSCNFKLRK